MDGIIPINKERGMTSHDVVAKVRGILRTKKVGHSGTLDPSVDGVLPVCVGRATKVVDYLMRFGKTYQGSITLGLATTTEDLDGEVVERHPLSKPLTDAQIDAALKQMTGELTQIPPMYSAVKVNGRKLYEYARAGETVERPKRKIQVYQFKQIRPTEFDEEKGEQIDHALAKFEAIEITDSEWQLVQNGGFLKRALTEPVVAVKYKGKIQALYQYDESRQVYRPEKMLLVR